MLGLKTINTVLVLSTVIEFEIIILRLKIPELVQNAREPVIRIIPEPISPLY